MNKASILLLLAFSLTTAAHAQQAPDLRAQAAEATRKLAQQISLDDARSVQVRRLTYERLTQENEVSRQYAVDAAMRQNKLRVVGEEYATKLQAVLSPAQFQRYMALSAATAPTPGTAATPSASRK
ncbi:hypothetical protein SAMN02745146_1293 [Hymenobacter daecheongensis DSM 21074]|uniref:LTXXQ motif family protein n=1 Tax=Hymenobacter daecheongensis DSM 21074 TaxID=1121955 RepID=A0A1M6CWH9_9BACT|nr:hypothetical protein [Hymenobacter daecheongensis]SHI65243.1 hypothetical protein SAMN02745146_1293 [Hymenobacter daecheongensis DSM 21074]